LPLSILFLNKIFNNASNLIKQCKPVDSNVEDRNANEKPTNRVSSFYIWNKISKQKQEVGGD
jgi:hypothetical protein